MGNNFSSIPSLPRGNPSRAPRGHLQNVKGKALLGLAQLESWGAGGEGQGEVERCGWGGRAGATCCAYLETGDAYLSREVGYGWAAADGDDENLEDGVLWGLRSSPCQPWERHWSPLGP